ncbi:hypothetical protein SAMN05216262_12916 [Colwellia chukchiensis]|uniref:Uncharacterized protein n=1 Tax=Colwellia chukchiensis TaxID=641665 RepID=A0A1H7TVB3_9GAMM|nr:hypothetical protein [Colwellia chukchiensis]SEL88593.1 hypothetical protein SAMN05216262_12916 [Colwellia chukchiensis]
MVLLKINYRLAQGAGVIGVLLGLLAFGYHYTFIDSTLPGYRLITAPAIFALSFFSPETAFWPKMLIFLSAQYLGYFLMMMVMKQVIRLARL